MAEPEAVMAARIEAAATVRAAELNAAAVKEAAASARGSGT